MVNRFKEISTMKRMLSVVLVVILLLSINVFAFGEVVDSADVNRFNVMLVVDASQSLISGEKSDPDGLRYDALKLFLGLLTENGNNVGAVVFNNTAILDTGVLDMNNMATKLALIQKIQKAGVSGDTNIGNAVLCAVNDLKGMSEKNGLPSVILLLSDGNTSLPHTYQMEQATKDAAEALQAAIDEGITIHSIWLNASGKGDSTEILQYTASTGGYCEEIKSADSLADAFQRFYTIINNTEYSGANKTAFDESGCADTSFMVPRFGVEEVNIVIDNTKKLKTIQIKKPDGSQLSTSDISNKTISTSKYQLIKLPSPTPGMWEIHLEGEANGDVDVSMLYNYSMSVELSSNNSSDAYLHNIPYEFTCRIKDTMFANLTSDDLNTMTATLNIVNAANQQTVEVPMTVSKDTYVAEYSFNQGSYYAYASVGFSGSAIKTNRLTVNVGNLAPVVPEDGITETIKTGLFHDGIYTLNLNDVCNDPEGEALEYAIENNFNEAVKLEDGQITADCLKQDEINFTVVARDGFGLESKFPVTLKEDNCTAKYIKIILITLAVIAAIIFAYRTWKNNLKCELGITVDTFDPMDNWESLIPLFNFHGKRPLYKMGNVFGARAKDYWFEATTDKQRCYFKSKKDFFYNNKPCKKIDINPGNTKIYFDQDNTYGIEIDVTVDVEND